jgi:hypothetical protein
MYSYITEFVFNDEEESDYYNGGPVTEVSNFITNPTMNIQLDDKSALFFKGNLSIGGTIKGKNMTKFFLFLSIITVFLCSCTAVTPEKQDVTPVEENKELEAGTTVSNPSMIISPTATKALGAIFPIVSTPIWHEVGNTDRIPACIQNGITDSQQKDLMFPGTILYQEYPSNGLYALDGNPSQTGSLLIPEEQSIHVFGISPDGKWLAYSPIPQSVEEKMENADPTIILLGADGNRIEHMVDMSFLKIADQSGYELEKFAGGYWLNNRTIFGYVNSKIPEDNPNPNGPIQTGLNYPMIIDPFQGITHTQLMVVLPDTEGFYGVSISPDQKQLLSGEDGITLLEISEKGTETILWSDKEADLASFYSAGWSPNSSLVVINSLMTTEKDPLKLLLVSEDGKVIKEIKGPMAGKFIKYFYWSPNSQYFAFIFQQGDYVSDVFIFDAAHDKFVLECPILTRIPYSEPGIAWSPDSTRIIISEYNEPLKILNINNGQINLLNVVGKAVGWSDLFKIQP